MSASCIIRAVFSLLFNTTSMSTTWSTWVCYINFIIQSKHSMFCLYSPHQLKHRNYKVVGGQYDIHLWTWREWAVPLCWTDYCPSRVEWWHWQWVWQKIPPHPLLETTGLWVYGVASYGRLGCATSIIHQQFTRVSSFLDWMYSVSLLRQNTIMNIDLNFSCVFQIFFTVHFLGYQILKNMLSTLSHGAT